MGSKKVTTTQTIPGAGAQESQFLQLLQEIANQAGGQLGNLEQLAQGNVGGPTGADRALVEQSIGASSDIATGQLEGVLSQLSAKLDEQLTARGIQGSSIEGFERAGLQSQAFNQIASLVNQSRQEGGQALLNLPFQRAGVQLNANQALFQRLTGTAAPVLQSLLQSRLAQGTTTQTQSGISAGELAGLGKNLAALGAAPFTGGASLGALGGTSGAGGIGGGQLLGNIQNDVFAQLRQKGL